MWLENEIFSQDLKRVCDAEFIPWEFLRDKTIFVTGATGLIGYALSSALLYANRKRGLNLTVLALVRNEERARARFAAQLTDSAADLQFVSGSMEEFPLVDGPVDYILHGASQTASKAFVQQPVETICEAIHGVENILNLAREKQVSGMVYLSSMEVYGFPQRGQKISEDKIGALSPLDIRNSYPLSKQQCENLCCAYASEYKVPAKIVRLTQTFGPGVSHDDNRIFAYFGRCVKERKNIVLKTCGETQRCYLYTADAVTALLTVLLKGEPGQAYNAAQEETYCSIVQMAQKVARAGGLEVEFQLQEENHYPSTLYINLDTTRLKSLGWKSAGVEIETMYKNMVETM